MRFGGYTPCHIITTAKHSQHACSGVSDFRFLSKITYVLSVHTHFVYEEYLTIIEMQKNKLEKGGLSQADSTLVQDKYSSRQDVRRGGGSMSITGLILLLLTPGTSSATPWSMYLFTTLLISVLSFSVISVFFGFISCPIILKTSCPPWHLQC